MAQISEITVDRLFENFRFDSEYFEPKYLHNQETLAKLQTVPLNDPKICVVSDGNHLSVSEYFSDEGIPYYRGQNINDFFLENAEPIYIPKEIYQKGWMKRSHFKKNDILLSIVGTVGSISLVTEEIKEATGSCKIAILRPQNINPYYLGAFLLSKYGQDQIKRNIRGAVQMGLILEDMKFVNVFVASEQEQEKISEIVDRSVQNNRRAKSLYAQAEQLLLQELGLEDFTSEWAAGYETDYDNVLEVARMDAEYFQPRYRIVENKIKEYKNGWDYLPKLIEVSKVKIQIEPEKEYQYVELADINASIGIVDSTSNIFGADLPSRAQMKLKKDDVVVSSVEGSIDKVGLILSDDKNLVGSTGFHIFRSKAFTPEVNLILCKSPVLQYLFIREASGTILTAISSNSLKNIVVPKLDKTVQEKITKLVQESHKCVIESRQFLEQAKQEVEKMIEKQSNAV